MDIKQLSKGAHLLIPVDTPGGLFSAGDAHYAQGDSETCGTAIEMNATLHVRFQVRKGGAKEKGIRHPRFTRQDYFFTPSSVAVDLKISQLVDVPNMLVSAFLPEDIFTAS